MSLSRSAHVYMCVQAEQVVAGWIAAAEKSQGQSRIASMALVGQVGAHW